MKSRIFILVVLLIMVNVSSTLAQTPGVLEYMTASFDLDPAPTWDLSHECYDYSVDSASFGGSINITELGISNTSSVVRLLLLNEHNYNLFREGNGRDIPYTEIFRLDVFEDNETVFWDADFDSIGQAYFVYWYMEPVSRIHQSVRITIEMWDYEYYQPITHPTTTDITNTTTTTTTTTTNITTTTTTTDIQEDPLIMSILLGIVAVLGAVVIYFVVRPKKTRYVWEGK